VGDFLVKIPSARQFLIDLFKGGHLQLILKDVAAVVVAI